jgi:hypothetical protein
VSRPTARDGSAKRNKTPSRNGRNDVNALGVSNTKTEASPNTDAAVMPSPLVSEHVTTAGGRGGGDNVESSPTLIVNMEQVGQAGQVTKAATTGNSSRDIEPTQVHTPAPPSKDRLVSTSTPQTSPTETTPSPLKGQPKAKLQIWMARRLRV